MFKFVSRFCTNENYLIITKYFVCHHEAVFFWLKISKP